jgi:hypothetical protein
VTERPGPNVLGDMARALFVAATGLLALFLVAGFVSGLGAAMGQSGDPPPDTVVPALDPGDLIVVALAALVGIAGSVAAVHHWLRGSWHVVTVAIATWAAMVPFVWVLFITNFPGQH